MLKTIINAMFVGSSAFAMAGLMSRVPAIKDTKLVGVQLAPFIGSSLGAGLSMAVLNRLG